MIYFIMLQGGLGCMPGCNALHGCSGFSLIRFIFRRTLIRLSILLGPIKQDELQLMEQLDDGQACVSTRVSGIFCDIKILIVSCLTQLWA